MEGLAHCRQRKSAETPLLTSMHLLMLHLALTRHGYAEVLLPAVSLLLRHAGAVIHTTSKLRWEASLLLLPVLLGGRPIAARRLRSCHPRRRRKVHGRDRVRLLHCLHR